MKSLENTTFNSHNLCREQHVVHKSRENLTNTNQDQEGYYENEASFHDNKPDINEPSYAKIGLKRSF